MDNKLQHDPRTKQLIKDALYHHLYGPALKQFSARIEEIVQRNALMLASNYRVFIYKGVMYGSGAVPRKVDRLAPQLLGVMEAYLNDLKQLNGVEMPYVLGYINQVLNSSNELHDYLLLLPQSMHPPIQELIATCPCKGVKLDIHTVNRLKEANCVPIGLMKNRLFTNLLI